MTVQDIRDGVCGVSVGKSIFGPQSYLRKNAVKRGFRRLLSSNTPGRATQAGNASRIEAV